MSTEVESDVPHYELKAYPSADGFIGSIHLGRDATTKPSNTSPHTVVIVDRSGSMGNYVAKMVNDVLPVFFDSVCDDPNTFFDLITFDDKVEHLNVQVKDLKNLPMKCRGRTYMTGAVKKLKMLIGTFNNDNPIRLLTVSDGDIFDQESVTTAGAELSSMVSGFNIRVNSQAVRLFTSESQPDTQALCSLLQINNTAPCKLLDIHASTPTEVMAKSIADLFRNDGFSDGFTLTSESSVFFNYPWDNTALCELNLTTGHNVFWLKEIPTTDIKVNDISVEVVIQPELTLNDFYDLLSVKSGFIIGHMKVLKIVGTNEAIETSKRILEYFTEQEKILVKVLEECPENGAVLSDRVKRMVFLKRRKNLSLILATIANDSNVSKLNSAQKAKYLRQVDFSKNSRSLSKRAAKSGLDFDEVARDEVSQMAKHFHEIQDVDDSNHLVSFFSQDTTFGGIKALVEVSELESFKSFDVDDILQLLNIVGVACSGPIDDFPDPMTWRVDKIFLGCHVSVSDVIVAYNQSNGQSLKAPAIDEEITNVIPVFDDPRIGKFLKKHAPSLLEYTSSVGMRRVIADVPMTIGYTMCAGIWKMIGELNKNKSSLHLTVFQQFLTTFDRYIGSYFESITSFLKAQDNGKFSFYIGNNGISNMLSPLMRIYKSKDKEKLELIPNILRAIYTHEVWRAIRRAYKGKSDCDEIIKKMLYKLLGIDLYSHQTPLPVLFEKVPELDEIHFHDEPKINIDYMIEITKPLNYINRLTLIPKFFDGAINGSLDSIKDVPIETEETVLHALQIDYPYDDFLMLNVFQALRYPTRAHREDSDKEKMKIVDSNNKDELVKEVKDYVRAQYKAHYLSRLPNKEKQERGLMADRLAMKICGAETYEEMIVAWRNGISVGQLNYTINTPLNPAYKILCTMLSEAVVPFQASNIFKVLLTGVDNHKTYVWSGIDAVSRKQRKLAGPTRAFWAPGPETMFLPHP